MPKSGTQPAWVVTAEADTAKGGRKDEDCSCRFCGPGTHRRICFHPECAGLRSNDGERVVVATIYLELGSLLSLEQVGLQGL